MARQQVVSGVFVAASVVLAAACDNAESLSAPRRPESGALTGPRTESLLASGPGPMISAVAPNVCADVWAASTVPGTPLKVYQCHGGANQQFALQPSGEITAYNGALCLDVWQMRAKDGDPVVVYTCNGGVNQKWTLTAAGEIRTAVNGKCLDVWGNSGANGTKLTVYTCHGGANQKWTVQRGGEVEPPPVIDTAVTPVPPVTDAAAGGSAELPRVYLDTRMPAATGRTISVAAGGDLQAALDAAQPGDVVTLAPGATFVGNFRLPRKAGMTAGQWITVRTGGTLPAEGTRVSPADAGQMPKVLTPNVAPAVETTPGAQGWRLVGLEIGLAPSTSMVYSVVAFGTAGAEQDAADEVPGRLVLDRSYVHGSPSQDVRRCVMLNSASTAIVDSYVAECHSHNGDSQAIVGWNGPGPYKITNNRLEGAHENIAFGGADPSVPNLVPSDIEIRRNHIIKPLAWKGVWTVKNLFELKAGRRVLVEGNVFENNWVDGQNGFAFLWWSVNAEGRAPWTVTEDLTFRYNRVLNVAGGFNFGASAGSPDPVPMHRVTIAHNVLTGLDGSNGRAFQILGAPRGVTIVHNTAIGVAHDVLFANPSGALPSLVFRDNVTGGHYNFFASGWGMGAAGLAGMQVPAANVTGNVVVTETPGNVPPGNVAASSSSAVGFVNFGGNDLRLSSTSTYRASGTSGATPGPDFDKLTQLTQGVVR
jgi:hypothetical protein